MKPIEKIESDIMTLSKVLGVAVAGSTGVFVATALNDAKAGEDVMVRFGS